MNTLVNKAKVLVVLTKYGDALTFVDKVLALDTDSSAGLLVKSIIAYDTGNVAATLELVDKVLEIEPGNSFALSLKMMLL